MALPLIPAGLSVGDDVSEGINGDWYYVGKVEKITATGYYLFAGGKKYVKKVTEGRFKIDGEWVDACKEYYAAVGAGYFVLAKGVFEERNPHF